VELLLMTTAILLDPRADIVVVSTRQRSLSVSLVENIVQ
jgi:hypothetical protein